MLIQSFYMKDGVENSLTAFWITILLQAFLLLPQWRPRSHWWCINCGAPKTSRVHYWRILHKYQGMNIFYQIVARRINIVVADFFFLLWRCRFLVEVCLICTLKLFQQHWNLKVLTLLICRSQPLMTCYSQKEYWIQLQRRYPRA